MGNVSRTLCELVERYYKSLKVAGSECRIVVPGLTIGLATGLHEQLLGRGLPSYLIVNRDSEFAPSEDARRILASGLTSLRHGSMIMVTFPGEIPNLQDSLVGVGGTIRSFAFLDEWPWVEGENANFQFSGPFLDELVSAWTGDAAEQAIIKSIIKYGLLKQSSRCLERGRILLEEILDRFDPIVDSSIPKISLRFLFHCGIPFPGLEENLNNPQYFINKITKLAVAVDEAHALPDVRPEIKGRINDVLANDARRPAILAAIEEFFDGIGQRDAGMPSGPLSFRHCWQRSRPRWELLDAPLLEVIYGVPVPTKVILIARLDASRGVLSSDASKAVITSDSLLSVIIRVEDIPPPTFARFNLRITSRNTELWSGPCPAGDTDFSVPLSLSEIGGSSFRRTLRVSLVQDGKATYECRLVFWTIDLKHDLAAVTLSPFTVFEPTDQSQSDDGDKIVVSEPTSLYVVRLDEAAPIAAIVADDDIPFVNSGDLRILNLEERIDPEISPSGVVGIQIQQAERAISFEIEARDIERGEYTLESEYVVQIANWTQSKVRRLAEIFEGNDLTGYPSLGGITDQTRRRARLSDIFESENYNGEPVLTNLVSNAGNDAILEHGCWNTTGMPQPRFRFSSLSSDVQALRTKYSSARSYLLAEIWKCYLPDKWRPRYAAAPVFTIKRASEIEPLIVNYLNAYQEIIDYLSANRTQLSWDELFVLSYVDCVVQIPPDGAIEGLFLIGPWHPLVVAKRFMVQATLHDCGRRLLASGGKWRFHKLVPLIDQTSPFRWYCAPTSEDNALQYAYVSPTSDPGWMVGLGGRCIEGIESHCSYLRRVLGLECTAFPLAREQLAASYIKAFCHAFPGHRAIAIHADQSYSGARLVQSAAELLHGEDGPTIEGRQIIGGVHLLLHDTSEIEALPWNSPPVCVYEPDLSNKHLWPDSRDIDLLPPVGRFRLLPLQELCFTPRGDGTRSVFRIATRQISKGAGGIPSSSDLEFDLDTPSGSNLGDAFIGVLSRLSEMGIERKRASWSFSLPDLLNYTWNILPGSHADPAIFVHYIREGKQRHNEARALWDYKVRIGKHVNSYYILSRVSESVRYALNGSRVLSNKDVATDLIYELGLIGLAIGGEAMRSGSHALGVIGLAGAIRLMTVGIDDVPPPLSNDENRIGFLLPVDSFQELLGSSLDTDEDKNSRRADLVAIQSSFDPANKFLTLSFVGIECKYTGGKFPEENVDLALTQAERSFQRISELALSALHQDGMPERLALARLFGFGLRVHSASNPLTSIRESELIQAILQGRFRVANPEETALLFTTECDISTAQVIKRRGWWIRLGVNNWPGVAESEALRVTRQVLSHLFQRNNGEPVPRQADQKASVAISANTSPIAETTEVEVNLTRTKESIVDGKENPKIIQPILIGVDRQGDRVFYDPRRPGAPLENYNMMITGSSGKGKTQLVKSLVAEIRRQDKQVIMLDFKNDYAPDQSFLTCASLTAHHVAYSGLPYNPLIPSPQKHPQTSKLVIHVSQHITGISSILSSCFRLGAQQQAVLKDVIRDCFRSKGINASGIVEYDASQVYPDFNDIGIQLRQANALAYNRLDPLFDLDLFQAECSQTNFEATLARSGILDLSQIESEEIKNALARIFILSSHNYFNARPHSGNLNLLFVFDEAHRVLESENLARFVRECRAYGVGILLSSQYPSDFPQDISASLATKVIHGNGPDRERVRSIENLLGLQGREQEIQSLDLFQAYLSNAQSGTTLIETLPYPHYLVLCKLEKLGSAKLSELVQTEGLDIERMPIEDVMRRLRMMRLTEEINGDYVLVDR